MLGIPGDRRVPQNLSFTFDKESILKSFIETSGHQAPIRLCGGCGVLKILLPPQFHTLDINHRKIQFLEVQEGELDNIPKTRKESLHLCALEEKTFHVHEDAVDIENKTVSICDPCFLSLDYALNVSHEAPRQTFKFYDVGRIPDYLPELTQIEILSICRAVCFHTVFHLRALASGLAQQALRGHSICLPLTKAEWKTTDKCSLPRTDLSKHIGIAFMGVRSVWKIAKTIARTHAPLSVNIHKVVKWLKYLSSNGNVWYRDVVIPITENERDEKEHLINVELDKIISEASTSDSGMLSRLADEVRGHQQFAAEGGEEIEAPKDVALESIMVTKVPIAFDVETQAVTVLNSAINAPEMDVGDTSEESHLTDDDSNLTGSVSEGEDKDQQDGGSIENKDDESNPISKSASNKWKIHVHNELLNEYLDNHELLSKCFPTLYPLGLSVQDLGGSGPLSAVQRKTQLLFYDRRFATNRNFIFHHFNQEMRRQTNRNVSLRVDRKDPRTAELMELVNEDGFKNKLQHAVENPNSKEAVDIKKKVLPLVKILGSKVKWSPFERKSTLGRHYALYHAFGLPFLFGTISPGMRNSPLALRMCAKHTKDTWTIEDGLQLFPTILLSNIHDRDKSIMSNPVAAAEVFDHIINAFFTIIMGIPLKHLRGKKSDFTRILKQNEKNFVGAYGKIRAVYGVTEAQGSGGLHLHFHAWGILDHSRMARFIHDVKFRKEVTNFIDQIVTCKIPEVVVKAKANETSKPILAAEKYPNVSNLALDAARCRLYLQKHRHAATCWKRKNYQKCRMAYKRMISNLTYITELMAVKDETVGK